MKSVPLTILATLLFSAAVFSKDDPMPEKLSTLWTLVSLNMIGTDVLSSFVPDAHEELEDFAGGKENIKYYMTAGAVIYQIPISMIFLSKYMPYKTNRWMNITSAALSTFFIIAGGSTDPHYLFMASVETLTLSYITWSAILWPDPESASGNNKGFRKNQDLALNINSRRQSLGLKYFYKF